MEGEDLQLLERWSAGDTVAGNALFERYFDVVYRFFERKTDGDIDDLVQETFLACLRSRDAFRRQSSFKTFLLAIARNTLFGHWRRVSAGRRTLDFDELSIASLSTSAGTKMVRLEQRAALLEALRNLPIDQQLLLEMFYWEGLERGELAEVLEVAEATIGSRLFRARKSLQEALGEGPEARKSEADFDEWARGLREHDPLQSAT